MPGRIFVPRCLSRRVVPAYSGTLLTGLVSEWHLDDDGVWADSQSGYSLSETNNPGSSGGGVNLVRASNQYLSRASNAALQMGNKDWAWLFWAKPNAVGGGLAYGLMQKGNVVPNREAEIGIDANPAWFFYIINAAQTVLIVNVSPVTAPVAGTMQMIYAYHDATALEGGISVNNGAVATDTYVADTAASTASDLVFGAYAGANFWDGIIYHSDRWNRKLTAAEVTEAYNGGVPLELVA